MPRDYKARATARRKRQATPGWACFLGGLLVGLFISGLAWLKLEGGDRSPSAKGAATVQAQPKQAKPPKAEKKKKTPATPKPRFDFYTILPEMEVVVPEPEPEMKTPRRPPLGEKGGAGKAVKASYMLQMGSFRKYADADRLKASLALVGIEAEIQRVTVNGGEVFHRVRSGPYSREKVNALRARLKANKINSLLIKLKQ